MVIMHVQYQHHTHDDLYKHDHESLSTTGTMAISKTANGESTTTVIWGSYWVRSIVGSPDTGDKTVLAAKTIVMMTIVS